MPTERRRIRAAVRAAIQGGVGPQKPRDALDDEDAGDVLFDEASDVYVNPRELLKDANSYFSDLGAQDKQRFREAHRRIKHMKAVNAKGGDKDGFKYVIPKTVKAMAKQLDPNNTEDLPALKNGFSEDAAVEVAPESHDDKPMKRKKRNGHFQKDFYQAQVWKKWTQNAEKFLSRGRASSKLFEAQGKAPVGKRRGPAKRNAMKKL